MGRIMTGLASYLGRATTFSGPGFERNQLVAHFETWTRAGSE